MKDKITRKTTFDERRKVLIHKSVEDKSNDLGDLNVVTTAIIHEEGLKRTISDLEKRKKQLKEDLGIINKNLEEVPKMTPELQVLKEQLTKLQLINRKKQETKESKKKDEEQAKNCQTDLKLVEKDLKEIKDAIGSRFKL